MSTVNLYEAPQVESNPVQAAKAPRNYWRIAFLVMLIPCLTGVCWTIYEQGKLIDERAADAAEQNKESRLRANVLTSYQNRMDAQEDKIAELHQKLGQSAATP